MGLLWSNNICCKNMHKLSFTLLEKEGNIQQLIRSRKSIINKKRVKHIIFNKFRMGRYQIVNGRMLVYGYASIQADHISLHSK